MNLFDQEIVDFLCRRITTQEAEQIVEWVRNTLTTRIEACGNSEDKETLHVMRMVAHRVVQSIEFLLLKSFDEELNEQPLFAQYYALFLQSQSNTEDQSAKEALESKLRRKIEQRDAKRSLLLSELTQQEVPLRFVTIAQWLKREETKTLSAAQFDVAVETFVDHFAQRMLEKTMQHLIFPLFPSR